MHFPCSMSPVRPGCTGGALLALADQRRAAELLALTDFVNSSTR